MLPNQSKYSWNYSALKAAYIKAIDETTDPSITAVDTKAEKKAEGKPDEFSLNAYLWLGE
jgi:hypothetical protein